MLKTFRTLSLVEGFSLLLLLFVAMPAKYQFGVAGIVPVVGLIHGLLFLSYFMMSLMVSHRQNWSVLVWLGTLFAGVFPFGFLLLDGKLKGEMATAAQAG